MALKRVTLEQFSTAIINHYGREIMSRTEINSFAASAGYSRPNGWDTDQIARGKYRFSKTSAAKVGRVKIDYNSLNDDSQEVFEDLAMLTRAVAAKAINSVIVTGSAGVGKTHTVTDELNRRGLQKDRDYVILKSKTSPLGLYMTLFLHHDKIIILDDMDDALKNDDCASILKAALDSYEDREISWSSKRMVNVVGATPDTRRQVENDARDALRNGETDVQLPNRFMFKGHVIFISNLSSDKFDKAVMSRSMKIDLTMSDKQVFARMKTIVQKLKGISPDLARRAMSVIIDDYNAGKGDVPNMRTVINYAKVLSASGVTNDSRKLERLSKYC